MSQEYRWCANCYQMWIYSTLSLGMLAGHLAPIYATKLANVGVTTLLDSVCVRDIHIITLACRSCWVCDELSVQAVGDSSARRHEERNGPVKGINDDRRDSSYRRDSICVIENARVLPIPPPGTVHRIHLSRRPSRSHNVQRLATLAACGGHRR